jgi:hypothetical protein
MLHESHVSRKRKAIIPQLPKALEEKILDYQTDLARQDLLVQELYKQMHRLKDVNRCCDSSVCHCHVRGFKPARIARDRWLGFVYRDLLQDWVRKINRGVFRLKCTACTNPTYYYSRRIRNGQWVLMDDYRSETDCSICKGAKIVWTDEYKN